MNNRTTTRAVRWQANWELYEMCVNRQTRLRTFQKICALGVDRRTAAEMIQDCEREG